MSCIRSGNTKPERVVRSLLHHLGLRFRIHNRKLPGKPDIVLKKHKTVILVHGCFWHRHRGCQGAPFNSFQRQMNVEIYKHDEDKVVVRTTQQWYIKKEYWYKSDRWRNVLEKGSHYRLYIRTETGISYYRYISGWHMFWYQIKQFYKMRKVYKLYNGKWSEHELLECFEPKLTKEWWRRYSARFLRITHWRMYKQIKTLIG